MVLNILIYIRTVAYIPNLSQTRSSNVYSEVYTCKHSHVLFYCLHIMQIIPNESTVQYNGSKQILLEYMYIYQIVACIYLKILSVYNNPIKAFCITLIVNFFSGLSLYKLSTLHCGMQKQQVCIQKGMYITTFITFMR